MISLSAGASSNGHCFPPFFLRCQHRLSRLFVIELANGALDLADGGINAV